MVPRKSSVQALIILVVSSLLAAVALAAPGNEPRLRSAPELVGGSAPRLEVVRIAGNDPVDLGQLQGRVVILDFWATWCGPCRGVSRVLEALHQDHHGRGLTVVGISNEAPRILSAHIRRTPVAYTLARDTGHTMRRYAIDAIPTLVIIDRSGKVRDVTQGVNASMVRHLLGLVPQLLDEQP